VDLDRLPEPIVQAPLAGGPSTPKLAAAIGEAGGFGFLAAGYKTADAVREDIHEHRRLTDLPFGVNVFAPPAPAGDRDAVERYAARMRAEGARYGVEPGDSRHDDDGYEEKLALVAEERVAVVSFTFGCPDPAAVERLHEVKSDVWVTVTNPAEAAQARDAGADALVVQGFEAGGHRGYFNDDDDAEDLGLLVALRLTAAEVDLPLVAAGGIVDGAGVAAVLCAGAAAAQIGSALLLTPEAGTVPAYRQALGDRKPTRLTRAFSGRQARGIANRFMADHGDDAPAAYPDVHHLTTPIRAAARQAGDADAINLWAGQAYPLVRGEPAGDVVRRLGAEAREAVRDAARRMTGS
jgi:nitronate monooxygenase